MNIVIKENVDNVNEFMSLYDAVGWGSFSYDISKKALEKNIYSVSLYDDDKIIGYGRLVGDGAIFIYIHDIMVHPDYQGLGYGRLIINKLLEFVDSLRKLNPRIRLYVGASKGKEGFYKNMGFIERSEADLGESLFYPID